MKEVKLPLDLNPILNTYHNLAHPLGIISGGQPELSAWFPWLAHKFINCSYQTEPEVKFDVYAQDKHFKLDKVLDVIEKYICIPFWKEVNNWDVDSFAEYIKSLLDKKIFIRGTYNEKYNPAMFAYQKWDYCHDYLLFGYNDDEKIFYAAGYTSSRRYEEYKFPYSDFYASIFQQKYKYLWFRLIRPQSPTIYTTNYTVVLRDLNHYLNSTAFGAQNDENWSYGLNAWKKLIDYLNQTEQIDFRATKIFMEHHMLMNMRLSYFAEQKMIDQKLSQQYLSAEVKAKQAYVLSIKYNMTSNLTIKEHCAELVASVIEIDKLVLPQVVAQISETIDVN